VVLLYGNGMVDGKKKNEKEVVLDENGRPF